MGVLRILAFVLWGASLSLASPALAQTADVIQKAKSEGAVTVYSSWPSNLVHGIAQKFEDKYGIKVDVFAAGGAQIEQKLALEIRTGRVSADVVDIGDPTVVTRLAQQGAIEAYVPDGQTKVDERFLSPDNSWISTNVNAYPIIFNKTKVSIDNIPASYRDLGDAKWRDQIVLPSPNFGASQAIMVKAFTELYGWDYVEALRNNNPLISRGYPDLENVVATGERSVGPDSGVRTFVLMHQDPNVGVVFPDDVMLTAVGATGILKAAPHPNAAKLLIEFYLSDDVQQYLATAGLYPVIRGMAGPKGFPELSDKNLHLVDIKELEAERADMIERWTNMIER